jgi:uncharacterized protein
MSKLRRMSTALISGSSGLVGRALLDRIGPARLLVRTGPANADAPSEIWQPEAGPPAKAAFAQISTVFHLGGEPIGEGRWGVEKRRRIRDSRVLSTRHLVEGMADLSERPATLIVASAVGYYGSRGDELLTERSLPGADFLAEVCQATEQEAARAVALGVRVVYVRFGMVLAARGGALARMLPVFRAGLGGPLGSGTQWMPWVHIQDAVSLLLHARDCTELVGAVNVVAPGIVRNSVFTEELAHALKRPAVLRAPAFALRLGLGQMAEVVLASQHVIPEGALATGFVFRYPQLREALAECVHPEQAL